MHVYMSHLIARNIVLHTFDLVFPKITALRQPATDAYQSNYELAVMVVDIPMQPYNLLGEPRYKHCR